MVRTPPSFQGPSQNLNAEEIPFPSGSASQLKDSLGDRKNQGSAFYHHVISLGNKQQHLEFILHSQSGPSNSSVPCEFLLGELAFTQTSHSIHLHRTREQDPKAT